MKDCSESGVLSMSIAERRQRRRERNRSPKEEPALGDASEKDRSTNTRKTRIRKSASDVLANQLLWAVENGPSMMGAFPDEVSDEEPELLTQEKSAKPKSKTTKEPETEVGDEKPEQLTQQKSAKRKTGTGDGWSILPTSMGFTKKMDMSASMGGSRRGTQSEHSRKKLQIMGPQMKPDDDQVEFH